MTSSGVQAIQQCMARNDLYRESPFSIVLHKGRKIVATQMKISKFCIKTATPKPSSSKEWTPITTSFAK